MYSKRATSTIRIQAAGAQPLSIRAAKAHAYWPSTRLAHSRVALAQRDARLLGSGHQLLAGAVEQAAVGRVRERLGLHGGVQHRRLQAAVWLITPALGAASMSAMSGECCPPSERNGIRGRVEYALSKLGDEAVNVSAPCMRRGAESSTSNYRGQL